MKFYLIFLFFLFVSCAHSSREKTLRYPAETPQLQNRTFQDEDIAFLKGVYMLNRIFKISELELEELRKSNSPRQIVDGLTKLRQIGRFDANLVFQVIDGAYMELTKGRWEGNEAIFRGVSKLEGIAISLYSQSLYSVINPALRSKLPLSAEVAVFTQYLNNGLEKLPKFVGTVKRGVKPFSGWQNVYKKGDIVTEQAFTSTSADLKLGAFHYAILIYIRSINGKNISMFANTADEHEVLFKSGTKFQVLNVVLPQKELGESGEIQIFLQEIP